MRMERITAVLFELEFSFTADAHAWRMHVLAPLDLHLKY